MNRKVLTKLMAVIALTVAFAATHAQESKTMYIMKNGIAISQYAVSDVDSIIFYAPTPTNPGIGEATSTTDPGVVINGIRWATRNVDAAGTFAATPETYGRFYQWNRNIAWAATGTVTDWDATTPTGTTWEKSNDPSPTGWRVPTREEISKLFDYEKVTDEWTTQNGVSGRLFTDKATGNTLFLPAAGLRYFGIGTLYGAGTSGWYWSSFAEGNSHASILSFGDGSIDTPGNLREYGQSIRSVVE